MADSGGKRRGDRGSGSDGRPLYLQILEVLRAEILAGRHDEAGALPSETSLIERFAVSRITVRRAVDELERAGLVVRSMGKATRVVRRQPATFADVSAEVEGLRAYGEDLKVQVLDFRWQKPTAEVMRALELPAGERVLWISRLRRRAGRPVVHTSVHLPERLGARLDPRALEERQLVEILADMGEHAESAEQTMSAAPCPDELAGLLDLAPRAPIFRLQRLTYGAGGAPMLLLRSSFRWDGFSYRLSLHHARGGPDAGLGADAASRLAGRPAAGGPGAAGREPAVSADPGPAWPLAALPEEDDA